MHECRLHAVQYINSTSLCNLVDYMLLIYLELQNSHFVHGVILISSITPQKSSLIVLKMSEIYIHFGETLRQIFRFGVKKI